MRVIGKAEYLPRVTGTPGSGFTNLKRNSTPGVLARIGTTPAADMGTRITDVFRHVLRNLERIRLGRDPGGDGAIPPRSIISPDTEEARLRPGSDQHAKHYETRFLTIRLLSIHIFHHPKVLQPENGTPKPAMGHSPPG